MDAFAELQELTRKQYRELQREFPGQFELGGCLPLGKYYARPESRVVMLGINPGLPSDSSDKRLNVERHPYNYLVDDQDEVPSRCF